MFGRLRTHLGILLMALAALPAAAAHTATPVHRIVAVGDLHGDFSAWRDIAHAAGLVDGAGKWSGGQTVLVQAGDVPDRGPDSLKIIADLMRLQGEAAHAGGKVIALVGNHEAMNMTDDLRYVSSSEYAAFVDSNSEALRQRVFEANRAAIDADYHRRDPAMTSDAVKQAWLAATPPGMLEHQAAWHPDGKIGRWVAANPAVAFIDGTLFVHGGLSAAYAAIPIAEINRRVAVALKARDMAPESIINDQVGPLWYRGLVASAGDKLEAGEPAAAPPGTTPALTIEQELDLVLRGFGAKRIVIAHTPILSGIAVLYGGRLVRIDTGISAVYRGTPSYLEIVDGNLVPHAVERSAPLKTGAR